MKPSNDDAWAEAKRRCRLSVEDVRMAKELGFQPKSLIKNIPAPTQQWKAPVREWVRDLYEKEIGSRKPASAAPAPPVVRKQVIEFRNAEYPWPDKPDIPERVMVDPFDALDEGDADIFGGRWEPPSETDIDDENALLLRRQSLFRWGAQSIAIAMSELPEVQKVAAFGAVAQPLTTEVPRFREFRRHRIEILHECADLDLAVWTTDLSRLKALKSAMNRGLSSVHDTPWGGVAHHQVDVHIFDAESGVYRGRQCIFGQCPKPGKRECLVRGCGAQPFLQQFQKYRFNPAQFEGEPRVILFDRASGFLVRPPRIDAKPTRVVPRAKKDHEDDETWNRDDFSKGITDDDVPF
jgi:hypothetical protein